MCNKAVDNYPHVSEFVPECYKTQKISDKTVNTYASKIKFDPECLMNQEMRDKAVNRCFLYIILFLINIKLEKCVILLFLKILIQQDMLLINKRLNKCVMKLLMIV